MDAKGKKKRPPRKVHVYLEKLRGTRALFF